MPHATTAPGHRGPRRRAVLASCLAAPIAAVLLDGCSPASEASPADRTAAALRQQAARDCADLLERYDATVAAYPALGDRLRPLRAQVAQHLAAFGGTASARPSASASTSTSASASASTSASASASASAASAARRVPVDRSAALAALADAERRVTVARTAALTDAPPELARLLASVAAAAACHVLLLQGGA